MPPSGGNTAEKSQRLPPGSRSVRPKRPRQLFPRVMLWGERKPGNRLNPKKKGAKSPRKEESLQRRLETSPRRKGRVHRRRGWRRGEEGGDPECTPDPDEPDWVHDVKPVFDAKCASCRGSPLAGGAPFPLLTYADVTTVSVGSGFHDTSAASSGWRRIPCHQGWNPMRTLNW